MIEIINDTKYAILIINSQDVLSSIDDTNYFTRVQTVNDGQSNVPIFNMIEPFGVLKMTEEDYSNNKDKLSTIIILEYDMMGLLKKYAISSMNILKTNGTIRFKNNTILICKTIDMNIGWFYTRAIGTSPILTLANKGDDLYEYSHAREKDQPIFHQKKIMKELLTRKNNTIIVDNDNLEQKDDDDNEIVTMSFNGKSKNSDAKNTEVVETLQTYADVLVTLGILFFGSQSGSNKFIPVALTFYDAAISPAFKWLWNHTPLGNWSKSILDDIVKRFGKMIPDSIEDKMYFMYDKFFNDKDTQNMVQESISSSKSSVPLKSASMYGYDLLSSTIRFVQTGGQVQKYKISCVLTATYMTTMYLLHAIVKDGVNPKALSDFKPFKELSNLDIFQFIDMLSNKHIHLPLSCDGSIEDVNIEAKTYMDNRLYLSSDKYFADFMRLVRSLKSYIGLTPYIVNLDKEGGGVSTENSTRYVHMGVNKFFTGKDMTLVLNYDCKYSYRNGRTVNGSIIHRNSVAIHLTRPSKVESKYVEKGDYTKTVYDMKISRIFLSDSNLEWSSAYAKANKRMKDIVASHFHDENQFGIRVEQKFNTTRNLNYEPLHRVSFKIPVLNTNRDLKNSKDALTWNIRNSFIIFHNTGVVI